MSKNIISQNECTEVVRKLVGSDDNKVKVLDYDVDNYCDGYPGFLGEYFSLKIRFHDVINLLLNEQTFFII